MRAKNDLKKRGLSLSLRLGESVVLELLGKQVMLTVYETKRHSTRVTFTADPEVRIHRVRECKPGEAEQAIMKTCAVHLNTDCGCDK